MQQTGFSMNCVKYFYDINLNPKLCDRPIMTNEVIECISFLIERQPKIHLHEIQKRLINLGICTVDSCPKQSSVCKALKSDLFLTRKQIKAIAKESQTIGGLNKF